LAAHSGGCAANHVFSQNVLPIMIFPQICYQSCFSRKCVANYVFFPECATNHVFAIEFAANYVFFPECAATAAHSGKEHNWQHILGRKHD
jgi:hypothetical protein